jgi:hypothetical protein
LNIEYLALGVFFYVNRRGQGPCREKILNEMKRSKEREVQETRNETKGFLNILDIF